MITSVLGPTSSSLEDSDRTMYDLASGGILNDPSGFSSHAGESGSVKRPGIIDHDEGNTDLTDDEYHSANRMSELTVSGALAELHHAVSEKIKSWNPYFAKSTHRKVSGSASKTSSFKHGNNSTLMLVAGEVVKDGVKEEDRLGARTRVGKCTILFNGNPFWERCIRTHEQHDKVHGYRLHVLRHHLMDDVWSKPAYVLSLLLRELSKPDSERLDWLFWVDADTIILNPYVPIETFLPPPGTEFDDVHLIYSADWNGLNNGVFPVRVNKWSADLFAAIVSYRLFKPEDPLVFRDQSAMNSMMQEPEFSKHIVQVPQRWFNAYQGEHNETLQPYQIRRGDLLVHFAGVPAREERMQYWLERAEQHLDDWEVPVKSTSYVQEARDFWNDQKDLRKNKNQNLVATKDKAVKLMTTTDQQLNDYGDRLTDEQKLAITKQREVLWKILETEKYKENAKKMEEGMKTLSGVAIPLNAAIRDANKLLLRYAHEAIFSGEKDLLEGGFSQGISNPELEQISNSVKHLKNLVMAPEEFWNRHDVTTATNAVTEARAKLQEKADALFAEQKVEEEQAARAKALEDAKKAAQQEADEAQAFGAGEATGIVEADALGAGEATSSSVAEGEADAPGAGETRVSNVVEDAPPAIHVATVPGPTVWTTAVFTASGDSLPTGIPLDEEEESK